MPFIAAAPCAICGNIFDFNPDTVPSVRNHPICHDCVNEANDIRQARGLPPIDIPPGAYQPTQD